MESALQAYRQSKKTSMTRIDMLVGLYGATLKHLASGAAALRTNDRAHFVASQMTAYRCILALLEGIDTEQGEVAQNTQRLCLYVASLIQENAAENWDTAARILQPLHDSFLEIREEAIRLEVAGQIPALHFDYSDERALL
jgi:flagellin-specific chaperone FliS